MDALSTRDDVKLLARLMDACIRAGLPPPRAVGAAGRGYAEWPEHEAGDVALLFVFGDDSDEPVQRWTVVQRQHVGGGRLDVLYRCADSDREARVEVAARAVACIMTVAPTR